MRDLRGLSKPVDSLIALSAETNGLAFYNRNNLDDGITAILKHNSRYYLLGYEPLPKRKDNKYYTVTISLKRAGNFKIFAEQGYLYTGENPGEKQLHYALAYPGLFRQIPVEVEAATFYDPKGPLTCISLEIPGSKMPFLMQGDSYSCDLKIYGFFLNENGDEIDHFAIPYHLQLSREDYEHFRAKSFIYYHETRLPAGPYQLRTIIQDRKSGQIGADLQNVIVPAKDSFLTLSDLVLSQDIQWVKQTRESPMFIGQYRIVPEGDRSVRLGEPVYIYFQIYNLQSHSDELEAVVRFQLSNSREETVYTSHPVPIHDYTERRQMAVAVSHALPVIELGLDPGFYTLKVGVEDYVSGEKRDREIELELKAAP
ncbi:hypothetical protein MYX65_02290 [Acidobacteria bacterium AH-259-L09]|nr:hypothetical protein [Acidobacteria bacterium AH-259-L09]